MIYIYSRRILIIIMHIQQEKYIIKIKNTCKIIFNFYIDYYSNFCIF